MANSIEMKKFPRGLLLAGMAALTLALVMGIKYIMNDDNAAAPELPADQSQLFKEQELPSGQNPASRSETGSGGGLDMFSKTNAGYYGEEESEAASSKAGGSEVGKSTNPVTRKPASVKAAATAIPRLRPASFGTVSPGKAPAGGAGQSMPDISGLLKQALPQPGKKSPSGN